MNLLKSREQRYIKMINKSNNLYTAVTVFPERWEGHIQCLQKQTPHLCRKKWQPCKQHENLKGPSPENRTGSAAWEQCPQVQHRWWDSKTKNTPPYKNNNHNTPQALKSVGLCNDKVWHYTEEEEEEEEEAAADHFKDQVTACCSWKSKWLMENTTGVCLY